MVNLLLAFVSGLIVGILLSALVRRFALGRGDASLRARNRMLFTSALIAREQLRRGSVPELERQLDGIALIGFTGWIGSTGSMFDAARRELATLQAPGDDLVGKYLPEFCRRASGDPEMAKQQELG